MSESDPRKFPLPLWERVRVRGWLATTSLKDPHPNPLLLGERGRKKGCQAISSFAFAFSLFFLLSSLALAQDASRRGPVVLAAEKASPAVVSIIAAEVIERRESPFGGNPFFEDFFQDFFTPFQRRQTNQSLGSGVVIRPDGYVLTNEHVVVQAEKNSRAAL